MPEYVARMGRHAVGPSNGKVLLRLPDLKGTDGEIAIRVDWREREVRLVKFWPH